MSKKRELAREIRILAGEIKGLEIKRSRSQAALIEALIDKKDPEPIDLEYFRTFTAQIDVKRDRLKDVTKELEALL